MPRQIFKVSSLLPADTALTKRMHATAYKTDFMLRGRCGAARDVRR
jgi:hypothetical protein